MAPQRCSFLAFFAAILVATIPAAAQQVKWAVRHDTSSTAVRNVNPSDISTGTKGVASSEVGRHRDQPSIFSWETGQGKEDVRPLGPTELRIRSTDRPGR